MADLERSNNTNIIIPISETPKSPPVANKDKTPQNPPSSPNLDSKKANAEEIQQENINLALKYETLLKENKGETPEAFAVKKELNRTGAAYSSLRAEILKVDPDYEKQLRRNSTYYYATAETVTKKVGNISEVAPVATTIKKATQAELNAKAKEQLAIARTIAGKSGTLENLNSQLQSKQAKLKVLEEQNNSFSENNSGGVSKAEVNNAFNDFQSFLGAHRDIKKIVAKYNGNIDAISGGDYVRLLILARNFLGHAGKWREFASNSFAMMADRAQKYIDLKKRYENNPQPKASPNRSKIAKLKKEIEQLERRISPKAREMEELLFEFNQSKQELVVLINETNDDNKVIEALYKAEEIEKSWFGRYSVVGSSPTDYTYHNAFIDGFWDSELKQGGPSLELRPENLSKPITITPDYGSYNYVAWGRWAGGTTVAIRGDGSVFDDVDGHWIFGQETLDMPKQGSAQYSGTVMGGYVNHGNGTVEPDSIRGNITFTAGFNNGATSLNGNMDLTRNGANWVNATFNELDARDGAIQDFEASLTIVGGGKGDLDGTFYGPNATESAGSFYIDKQSGDMGGAAGVFRAKKQ